MANTIVYGTMPPASIRTGRRSPSPALGLAALAACAMLLFFWTDAAFAQGEGSTPEVGDPYFALFNELTKVLILAVLVEVGLNPLFRWKWFLSLLENKGAKVPIALIVSFLLVKQFEIDLPASVLAAFETENDTPEVGSFVGILVSTLILAGGTTSVNGIFAAFGWRRPDNLRTRAQELREQAEARLKIVLDRRAGGSGENKAVEISADGIALGVVQPSYSVFAGADGKGWVGKPGPVKVLANWTDDQGNRREVSREAVLLSGQTITLNVVVE